MTKKERLEALIDYYTKGNQRKFADLLGVTPQTVSAWLSRNTFDAEMIYQKCLNVSGDWLLSGEGPMIKSNQQNADTHFVDSDNSELIALCKSLVANYKQRDEVMGKLVSMVKGLE